MYIMQIWTFILTGGGDGDNIKNEMAQILAQ